MSDRSPTRVAVPVRKATPADHSAVRDVLRAAYQQYDVVLPPGVFDTYLADILDLNSRAATSELLVAELDGRVAGAVTFYPDAAAEGLGWPAGWAGLRALGVDPGARGQGVGHALMDACLGRARQAGAEVLCLHSAAFMTHAVAMYEAMGFSRVPEFDFEGIGDEPVQVLAYRLDLTEPPRQRHQEHA